MTTPDEPATPPATPEATPPAPTAAPPAEAPAEATATPPTVEPAAAPAPARRAPRQQVSDETLEAWQATLAEARARRQRQARTGAEARERAAAFRELRAALRRLEEEPTAPPAPQRDPIRDDALAVAVHEAPERLRRILAATLAALAKPRRRR